MENKKTNVHFLQGGWKTTEKLNLTRITAMPLSEKHLFRLDCTELVDSENTKFKFYVDGSEIEGMLYEGGSLFLEGKEIQIEQTGSGTNILATWECVQELQNDFYSSTWNAFPQDSDEILLAAFSQDTDFVVEFNRTNTNCSEGKMTLIIDGNIIKDISGKTLQFLEGSSIIGNGKHIKIKVTGYCSNNAHFSGRIKIQKEY